MRNVLKIIFLVLAVIIISLIPFILLTSADSQNYQQTKIIEKQIIKETITEKIIEKQPTKIQYSYPKYRNNYKTYYQKYLKAYKNKYKKSRNHRSGINYNIDRLPRNYDYCPYRTCSVKSIKPITKKEYKIPTRNYIPSKYIRYYPINR